MSYLDSGPVMSTPINFERFPWMRTALGEYGQREIPGRRHNPRIVEYFTAVSATIVDDETAWCSAFVNWVMAQHNITGTRRANARSWLNWGNPLPEDAPYYGAITVLWRVSRRSWKGHVGFYVGEEGNDLVLLGGNQGNSVSLRNYPKSRLLAYRWPTQFSRENVCRL